eukprot:364815-Chlamydomonas_euryale.AAC.13
MRARGGGNPPPPCLGTGKKPGVPCNVPLAQGRACCCDARPISMHMLLPGCCVPVSALFCSKQPSKSGLGRQTDGATTPLFLSCSPRSCILTTWRGLMLPPTPIQHAVA